jgi:hypothetical protein
LTWQKFGVDQKSGLPENQQKPQKYPTFVRQGCQKKGFFSQFLP